MWNRFGIRTQLILLMGVLLTIVEVATLGAVNYFDQRERRAIAIDQANTLARSLNNDLLAAILSSDADTYADISFRIAGYQAVDALTLFDAHGKPVLRYGRDDSLLAREPPASGPGHQFLDSGHLLYHKPVEAEGQRFGDTVILVNLAKYQTQLYRHHLTLLLIFPIELLIGLTMAWFLSRGYTRPFNQLAMAMQANDFGNQHYQRVETRAQNEIHSLFDGYNAMLDRIQDSAEELFYRSRHDSLTGLYNRYAIDQALVECLRRGQTHVLLNMDLDQFSLVNDSLGRTAGDELLQMIAQHCRHDLPDQAMMARIGGDDFYLLLPDTAEREGIITANRYLERLRDFRFFWQGQAVSVSASIGLVAFRPGQFSLEELIKAADLAFYGAKAAGRNQLNIYHPDSEQTSRYTTEVQMAGLLKEALGEGPARFELYAQAIVPLQAPSERIGYEVLLRLRDGRGELVSPLHFLPTAERYQMMVEIDGLVLQRFLETVCSRPGHLDRLELAHINLSGGSLNHPDFQKRLRAAIAGLPFPWRKLELEITETSAVGNFAQARAFIDYCRGIGIGFALDDFGTGMASFEYLKNLPFDVIKIDGSFIRNMHSDPVDHAMISYIQEISKLKGQKTVAEYVETARDLEELRRIGITYGQGYYLGRPKPLTDWL